jgi:hypothetical protein
MHAGSLENPVCLTRYRRHDRLTDWSLPGGEMGFSKAIRLLNILCFTMLGAVCIVNQAAAQAPGYANIRHTPVTDGRLGLWDTTGITDGFYTLRLRVHLSNNIVLESFVEGLRIRNSTAIETATPQPDLVTATPTIALPTRTPRPTPLPLPGGSNPSTVLRTFTGGIIAGVVVLLSLGIYLFIRKRSQERWAVLQMRQMLRNANRKKRR